MPKKYNKYVGFITILTILILLLLTTNKINPKVFLLFFIPLSISMLILGFLELKKTIRNNNDIESHALKIKTDFKNKNK